MKKRQIFFVPGISFIEITIGLFISSILSIFLFQFFGQITKTSKTLNNSLEYITTMPTVFDQLERDISGIYVPEILYEPKKKRKAPKDLADGAKQSQQAIENGEKKEGEEIRPIAFFCETKNNQFMVLSFITTYHLPRFKQADPEKTLVVYRLIPDKDYPDSFALIRQQATDILLPLKKFEDGSVPEYMLLRRIHRFKVSLIAPEKEKTQEKAQKTEQPAASKSSKLNKSKTVEEFSWTPDEVKKKLGVLIPSYIEIEGTYADGSGKQQRDFKFAFKVYTFADHAERMRQEREKKEKLKQEKKPSDQKKHPPSKKTGNIKQGKPQNKPKPSTSGKQTARPTRRSSNGNTHHQSIGGW